jgi:hypothetical protein
MSFLRDEALREKVLAHLEEVGKRQTVLEVARALRERPEQVASALGVLAGEGRVTLQGDVSPLRFSVR